MFSISNNDPCADSPIRLQKTYVSQKVSKNEKECKLTENLALHPLIIFPFFDRNRYSPRQIPRKRRGPQPTLQARVDNVSIAIDHRVWGPFSFLPRFFHPFFRLRLDGVELEVHMRRDAGDNVVGLVDEAAGLDELYCV
jgi:hypothetical protein